MNMHSSAINKFKIQSKNFKIIKEINKGAFGVVYDVKEKETGKHYAAKVINTGKSKQSREMVNREVQIMMRVSHPTLIGFLGFSTTDFSGNKNVTVFMELTENGSLEDVLEKAEKGLADINYDNTARQIILVGISYGMMILHKNYVIHRDLKPGNILIDKEFYPHITDFGLSKFFESGHSKSQSKSCGTPAYMAPEVIAGERYNGKADVYSFGIIMYQILTEKKPYTKDIKIAEFKLNKKIIEENYRPKFDKKIPIKKSLRKLIEKCWSKDPNERPTFEEIFNKLAYNRNCAIYNILEDMNDEDNENDGNDETPYYLNNVNVDELFIYIDTIIENTNSECTSKSQENACPQLNKAIENMQQAIDDIRNENSNNKKLILAQKKRIDEQQRLIEQQRKEIHKLKSIILYIMFIQF